jgi:microcystin-dependent protein
MSAPFVGEIRMFGGNFAPAGWMFCQGQLLPISENETLFNLIGTTYGGDGQQTFQLPNLAGKVPAHAGSNAGTTYVQSQTGGATQVTLTTQQIPNHNHALIGATSGGVTSPSNAYPGSAIGGPNPTIYGQTTPNTTFDPSTISAQGGNQPHDNMQPYQAITFIISLFGVFPSQS